MSVVKRCPNCGTTQAAAGECEACHEGQVRYFCTNHEPGVWLAGPTCPQCDARAALPARPPASTSEEASPDLRPSRRALRERPLRDAVVVRPLPPSRAVERAPAPLSPERGWLPQLALRLALIAVILVVALGVAVYLVARSLH